ncbi:MAG: YebC/PmpR family DNA-binding transcriptional regulator [bacterium]
MSGHSKWATTKRRKSAADAKRGKIFTKIIREIMVAARMGGGDPDKNARLRTAIEKAKANSMPKENIERAIKKGTGEIEGETYEESVYEGYGAGGVAVYVKVLTDNKNRTVSEIRHIFSRCGGSLGESGCVSWMFDQKGYIAIRAEDVEEDKLMEIAIEAGAEDMSRSGDTFEIITDPSDFESVKKAIQEAGVPIEHAEISMIPQSYVRVEGKEAEQVLRLMDMLDESEEVQSVYSNFDIPDELMEAA